MSLFNSTEQGGHHPFKAEREQPSGGMCQLEFTTSLSCSRTSNKKQDRSHLTQLLTNVLVEP